MPNHVPKLMRKPYQRQQHPLTRWLSCALLVLITHGATAELIHRHGGLSLSSAVAEPVAVLSGTSESETAKPPLLCTPATMIADAPNAGAIVKTRVIDWVGMSQP